MDGEGLLQIFWLVIIGIWALATRLARKRRQRDAVPSPPPREDASASESPMSELDNVMERLRDALSPREVDERPPAEVWEEVQPEPVLDTVPETPREPVPPAVEDSPSLPPVVAHRRRQASGWLTHDLRTGSRSLARAMVLREVLGPPVALRSQIERAPFGENESS